MLITSALHLSICAWSITSSHTSSWCWLWYDHWVLMTITSLPSITRGIRYSFLIPSWSNQHCCACLNIRIFLLCSGFNINLRLICINVSFLDTAWWLALSWRFLWFRVERDNFVNLFQNFDHSMHILRFLDILSFHLLNVLRYRHIWTFENVDSKVQILQCQLLCQSFIVHKLLDFLLIWGRTHNKAN